MRGEGTVEEVLVGEAAYAVVVGDCRDVLKGVPANVFHVCYTDPPYGLSKQNTDDVVKCLKAWLDGREYVHSKNGIMDQEWDSFVPGPDVWLEVERTLLPGGWLASFSSTRTIDLLGIAIRLSKFETRENWAWLFGNGFPKGHDISRAVEAHVLTGKSDSKQTGTGSARDRSGQHWAEFPQSGRRKGEAEFTPLSNEGKEWTGYNISTRPAYEPIYVARKELDGTNANNCVKHGAGALNINGARIAPSANEPDSGAMYYKNRGLAMPENRQNYFRGEDRVVKCEPISGGRWPPAVAVCHEEVCERVGTRRVMAHGQRNFSPTVHNNGIGFSEGDQAGSSVTRTCASEEDGLEEVDDWRCSESCAVLELARQSGICEGLKTCELNRGATTGQGLGFKTTSPGHTVTVGYDDTGSAARFFWNAKASAADRYYWVTCTVGCQFHEHAVPVYEAETTAVEVVATEGKKRKYWRCKSCDAERTHYGHPTAKPNSLCAWHATLLRPPPHVEALALEPFCGSGAVAEEMLGARFRVIAIDLDPRHVAITRERMKRRWEAMLRESEVPPAEAPTDAAKAMPVKKAAASQLGLFGEKK